MSDVTIRCNNVPREIIDGFHLNEKDRQEFDYIDWEAIDNGSDGASFFRYKGNLYDLGEAMYINAKALPADSFLKGWQGYYGDSFFSGVLVKYTQDCEQVIIGQYFS